MGLCQAGVPAPEPTGSPSAQPSSTAGRSESLPMAPCYGANALPVAGMRSANELCSTRSHCQYHHKLWIKTCIDCMDLNRIFNILPHWPLPDHARISQDLLRRTSTRSCENTFPDFTRIFTKYHKIFSYGRACHAKWAGLKSDNSFTKRVEETKLWSTLCENLRGRNGYGHFTRELLREPAQAKAGGHNRKNPSAWTHLLGKNHPRVVGYYYFCAWFFTKLI